LTKEQLDVEAQKAYPIIFIYFSLYVLLCELKNKDNVIHTIRHPKPKAKSHELYFGTQIILTCATDEPTRFSLSEACLSFPRSMGFSNFSLNLIGYNFYVMTP